MKAIFCFMSIILFSMCTETIVIPGDKLPYAKSFVTGYTKPDTMKVSYNNYSPEGIFVFLDLCSTGLGITTIIKENGEITTTPEEQE